MTILIVLTVLFVASFVVAIKSDWGDWYDFPATMLAAISGSALAVALLLIPLNHMDIHSRIAGFNAVRDSRAGGVEIEAAAWRMKVAEENAWLAKTRYYNRTLFDLWIPDEIEQLEPIR